MDVERPTDGALVQRGVPAHGNAQAVRGDVRIYIFLLVSADDGFCKVLACPGWKEEDGVIMLL